jgi:nascent polypeptide-associated complex subunit alpha
MKKMGMQASQIDAEEVVIKTPEKDIVISQPQVTKINMMGQETYQVVGEAVEREREKFTDDDVKMVVEQTGVSEEEAGKALEETGDLAEAILKLKKG